MTPDELRQAGVRVLNKRSSHRPRSTGGVMSVFLTILAIVIAVPIGLLIWMAIGVKRSMNRNDNRKDRP